MTTEWGIKFKAHTSTEHAFVEGRKKKKKRRKWPQIGEKEHQTVWMWSEKVAYYVPAHIHKALKNIIKKDNNHTHTLSFKHLGSVRFLFYLRN